jgi:hypothetical protein
MIRHIDDGLELREFQAANHSIFDPEKCHGTTKNHTKV